MSDNFTRAIQTLQTITLPDLDTDQVTGNIGEPEPFRCTIREFMQANEDDFADKAFAYDFLYALAVEGVFLYPASMMCSRIELVRQ